MAMYAPIIIPTLNRYQHFRRCVDSLAKCSGASETELFIGLDYPPTQNYFDGYKKICEYIPEIVGFKNIVVIKREKNWGADANMSDLFAFVSKQYDRYIFTEDDNEFSPNFLEYINWGLNKFQNDPTIYAICGFKNIETSDINNNIYKLNTLFNAWGYGSWFAKREKLKTIRDFEYLRNWVNQAKWLDMFSSKVFIISSLLYQIVRKSFFEDCLISLLPENERWCIFPKVNKVRNWGWDGTGIHGGTPEAFKKYSSLPIDVEEHFTPAIVEDLYNSVVFERFKRKYKKAKIFYLRSAVTFLCYKLTKCIPVANKKNKWCKVKLLKVQ